MVNKVGLTGGIALPIFAAHFLGAGRAGVSGGLSKMSKERRVSRWESCTPDFWKWAKKRRQENPQKKLTDNSCQTTDTGCHTLNSGPVLSPFVAKAVYNTCVQGIVTENQVGTGTWWCAKELAQRLGVSERTVWRWASNGWIRRHKIGHTVRFRENEVLEDLQRLSGAGHE